MRNHNSPLFIALFYTAMLLIVALFSILTLLNVLEYNRCVQYNDDGTTETCPTGAKP